MSADYRPHLDGIRAVAVVVVIAFHLGYPAVAGGFIGVDVFFVLSGYLITGILLTEALRTGGVGLRRFYARRARRLLPASLAVLLVVMLVGLNVLDAVQRQDLGFDVTWAALYAANWRFATAGGEYFGPGDVPSPIIHFWSLAVEEQFYLVWPALLLGLITLASRRGSGADGDRPAARLGPVLVAVLALTGMSIAASLALTGTPMGYYATHSRAYQMLAGAALAIAVRHRGWSWPAGRAGRLSADGAVLGALVVLALQATTITDASQYPGVPGLIVTVASLALIAGLDLGPPGGLQALVGHQAMAAVGRLSYSLYIWHWPVIVLVPVIYEDRLEDQPWLAGRPFLVAVMVALALASYLVIERPIRFRAAPGAAPLRVVAVGLTGSVAVAALAFPLLQPRDPFAQQALRAVRDRADSLPCPYFADEWAAHPQGEPCALREGDGPVIAVVGDSHAQQWQPALLALAEERDATLLIATYRGCPPNDVTPFAEGPTGQVVTDTACSAWRRQTFPTVGQMAPDLIFVATASHTRGIQTGDTSLPSGEPDHVEAWADGWDWTLETLTGRGAPVVISTILPTLPEQVPACLIDHGEGTDACDFPVAVDELSPPYNEVVMGLADRTSSVSVVDPRSFVCPGGACPALIDGQIVHRDDDHLTASFVEDHAEALARLMAVEGVDL